MYSQDDLYCFNILESINKILDFTKEIKNYEEFKNDQLHFDATIMNFIVIGEMTSKLSEEFKEKHTAVKWHEMYGFRNIMAHDYFGISEKITWQIIQDDIPELKIQIEKILE
jgi:uncharacterized protein with HEPN domain